MSVTVQEEEKCGAECSAAESRDWCVYLLTCADGTFYCGVTKDISRRLDMHNGLLAGGARYTRGRRPVILTACVEGLTQGDALRLERKVKKAPRAGKASLLLSPERTE